MTSENSKQLAVTPLHSHNGLETPQKSAHVKPSIMSLSPEKDGETSDQDSESDLTVGGEGSPKSNATLFTSFYSLGCEFIFLICLFCSVK